MVYNRSEDKQDILHPRGDSIAIYSRQKVNRLVAARHARPAGPALPALCKENTPARDFQLLTVKNTSLLAGVQSNRPFSQDSTNHMVTSNV